MYLDYATIDILFHTIKSRSVRIWSNTHINDKNWYKNQNNGYDRFGMHTYMHRGENGEEAEHTYLKAGKINDS
jgi:hypothetical protein